MDHPVLPDLFVVEVEQPVKVEAPKTAPFRAGSHSSWTGAQSQDLPLWTAKQEALLQMLGNGQPLTRNQLAFFLLWPLSSVCSVLDSVRDRIEFVDWETVEWNDGKTTKTTKRERFQVKR